MRRRTKIGLAAVGVIVVFGGVAAVVAANGGDDEEVRTVTVSRGDIIDKALAVGRIEPEVEVEVKSEISGVVNREFAEVGQFVRAGTPLLEIRPTPTPIELVEARRQIELRELELANERKELERKKSLLEQGLISQGEYDSAERSYSAAELNRKLAGERLALLEEGRVRIANDDIEAVVKSPIDGFILQKNVEIGDPVVPLNPYQEGTVLMSMAEMSALIFRGTVDEIDVGRLAEGMPVEIKVGALPNTVVPGELSKISLKARTEDNSTVFPIEIALERTEDVILRAGYSANADIIIDRREGVLTIPERLITFTGDTARVTVLRDDGTREERIVQTGLSDAINIEVISGLDEGERVLEPPPREL